MAVLHDIDLAARYATTVIALNGRIAAAGPPSAVFTAEAIARVFRIAARPLTDSQHGGLRIVIDGPIAHADRVPAKQALGAREESH
ncbi:MAG: hypothetical protein ACKVSF_15450 [Alphaproteobacteria bacterium]